MSRILPKLFLTTLSFASLLFYPFFSAQADIISFSASTHYGTTFEKQLGLSYNKILFKGTPLGLNIEAGILPMGDFLTGDFNYYISCGPSVDLVAAETVYIHAHNNITYAGKENFAMSSHFQVLTAVGLGLQNKDWRVGIAYRHMSNGKLYNNLGHNWYGLEIGYIK